MLSLPLSLSAHGFLSFPWALLTACSVLISKAANMTTEGVSIASKETIAGAQTA